MRKCHLKPWLCLAATLLILPLTMLNCGSCIPVTSEEEALAKLLTTLRSYRHISSNDVDLRAALETSSNSKEQFTFEIALRDGRMQKCTVSASSYYYANYSDLREFTINFGTILPGECADCWNEKSITMSFGVCGGKSETSGGADSIRLDLMKFADQETRRLLPGARLCGPAYWPRPAVSALYSKFGKKK